MKMMKYFLTFLVGGYLLVTTSASYAVCVQSGASTADVDLWAQHECWQDYINYQYQAYDLEEEDWGNRGWNDDCNVNYEYPKHWNASYLIDYGLADDNDNSFHGMIDYENTAKKYDTNYHDNIFHTATDDGGIFGRFVTHVFGADEIQTACPLYNPSSANANPGSRAGDFMHEGWHAYFYKWDVDNGPNAGHRPSQGACNTNSCDYFYFHPISAYVFGAMWENDGTANRFHSPNQVQVEFLCDVSDFPQWWIPNSVRIAAASDANARSSSRFINGPGYFCGDPRPF
jgi:hypothetical protein